jgi:hypothetical protein
MTRFLVTWRNGALRRTYPVGVLVATEMVCDFSYLEAAATTPDFRAFVNFPELDRPYNSTQLFPFFSQRVMDRRRPDHAGYVRALGLPADATDLELLGRANGQRKGDTVQVILEPTVGVAGEVDHSFLVSGVRHAPGESGPALAQVREGDRLLLLPEPENPSNVEAILVSVEGGQPLGWIPDALLPLAHEAMACGYELTVLRLNGEDWPSHLRLVVRLTASVSADFEPFPSFRARALG